jgi:hypothetical protein
MRIEIQRQPAGGSYRQAPFPVGRFRAGERGSAVLVVLALLFLMAAMALGNNRTLHQLHQELDLLEQHQLRDPESLKKFRSIVPASAAQPSEPVTSEVESPSPTDPAPEPETQP